MKRVTKDEALALIDTSIQAGERKSESDEIRNWDTWANKTKARIRNIFGEGSSQLEDFEPILDQFMEIEDSFSRKEASEKILSSLKSFRTEITEFWSDSFSKTASAPLQGPKKMSPDSHFSNEIFIIHGHNEEKAQTLARFLERLGLAPIILHEKASKGSTIIEKLEQYADASYAIALLTGDDIGTMKDEQQFKPRARQNVIMELGFFIGRLGRDRTCALLEDGVEVPSDYTGVVYISLDKKKAWQMAIAKELNAAGFGIDLNQAL